MSRPFAGLAGECDWVALRQLVPAGTARLRLTPETGAAERTVLAASLLPFDRAGRVCADGRVLICAQAPAPSGDPSRDLAAALLRCLDAPSGTSVPAVPLDAGVPGDMPQADRPRLQDVLDPVASLDVHVHPGFDFWLDELDELDELGVTDRHRSDPDLRAAAERATAAALPTARLATVQAAYWCVLNGRSCLRWVLPYDEEPLLDAMARLHVAGMSGMGEGSRLLGTFRAHGLLVPVWQLADSVPAEAVEAPAARYAQRLDDALATTTPLTSAQRDARAGLLSRQLTLR